MITRGFQNYIYIYELAMQHGCHMDAPMVVVGEIFVKGLEGFVRGYIIL